MRILIVAGFALASGGCALFGGSERSLADVQRAPIAAPQPARTAARESFEPAFGVGRPVALVPCRDSARLSVDCRSRNERHQVRGEMPAGEDLGALSEASLAPVSE